MASGHPGEAQRQCRLEQGRGISVGDNPGDKHASFHLDTMSSRGECSFERFVVAHLQHENLPTELDEGLVSRRLRGVGWPMR